MVPLVYNPKYNITAFGLERPHAGRLWQAYGWNLQTTLLHLPRPVTRMFVMSITIQLPGALRVYCEGASTLSLSAASVRAALEQIEQRHPALYRSVCDETGTVRRHVNLFVNTSNVRDRVGLDTALAPGDVITILPALSVGSTFRFADFSLS